MMTDAQRNRIKELRSQGKTYKAVSEQTGIPVNTIKTYCNRHGLNGRAVKPSSTCLYCGKPLVQTPGRRQKKFCNDTCRTRWWSHHRTEHKSQKGMHHLRCAYCGKEFTAYGDAKRKYCCHGCYIKDRFGTVEEGSSVHGIYDDVSQMA